MKVIFLSAHSYEDSSRNYGDCILIDSGTTLTIFDCGCEEHANRALEYMKSEGYSSAKFILSHNDADHFDGLQHLIDEGVISEVNTLLLLKYKKDLLWIIGDGRITEDSLTRKIEEYYDNIYSLSGQVTLVDALELPQVQPSVKIVGPEKEYALQAVAKLLDNREGDTIDGETIHNAICFQTQILMDDGKNMLLSGDSAHEPLEENLKSATYIQLPHHGKKEIADKIFEQKDREKNMNLRYYVSDNTGDTNGGADKLRDEDTKHSIKYTDNCDIVVNPTSLSSGYVPGKTLGYCSR